ncbi:MAG: 23S rRNA (uracil(1939)-C(5))-methyltransferase RlmD [Gammaproteobacteria bacterium]
MAGNTPAEIADVIDLTLEGAGVVASPGGKRVLVPGALAGEQISFRRQRRRRNFDEGVLLEVLRASPQRAVPACEYFSRCGGCALQHLDPAAQLAMKQTSLLDSLQRIGRVVPERVLPPISAAVWGYRRRARLAVRHVARKGRVLVGFREREQPRVVDMLSCETMHPAVSRLLPALSELVGALSIRTRLPQIEVTVADNATALVLRVLDPPGAGDLDMLRSFALDHGLRIYLQSGGPESVAPLDPLPADDDLCYAIPAYGLSLRFGPVDFIQVHPEVNLLMIDQAIELLAPAATDRVLDLYCGIGNFTLPLATRAAEAVGIEGARPALERARQNAAAAGLANTRFIEADLSGAGAEGAWTRESFDLVLLDPPRTGAAALLPALAGVGARRIVYVSCHPGTLARDAGLLVTEHGYRLAAAGAMDMFPQTSHVESMALFVKN